MSGDSADPGPVVLVDPEDLLTSVGEALRRGGIDDVRRVDSPGAIDSPPEEIGCVIVPHRSEKTNGRARNDATRGGDAGSDATRTGVDGIAEMNAVRERLGDVPVGVYVFAQDRAVVARISDAGADTVLRAPPERETLLATRVRHLAGVADDEPQEKQFRSLLEHYPQAIYLKDVVGRFVNITRYAFGGYDDTILDREDVFGMTDFELYDEDLATALYEEEQQLLDKGEPIDDKIEHFVEDGKDKWVSTTKVPRYDDDGNLLGLVGDVRDVTSIKRQERMMATLHDASRRLVRTESKESVGRTAVEIATDLDVLPQARVDLFDADTGTLETVATVEDVDWTAESFRRAAAAGTPLYRTGPEEFLAVEVGDHDHRELELPEGVDVVRGLRLPLGDHGVFGVDAGRGELDPFTIELAHVLAANVEAALDRAEQEQRLTAQSQRLEEFAALSSHELRNRLQIALGTAERARQQGDPEAMGEVIEMLGRMNRLVSQLLTLARTGSITRATESLALSGVVETAWHAVDDADATLSIESDAIVTADREALLEIFEMLFRTTVDGSNSEHVRVGTLDDGFFLADDESSVDPEDIFEPTYSDGGATGDSIYMVSEIAAAHGWDVELEQRADGGTRFEFRTVDIAHVE